MSKDKAEDKSSDSAYSKDEDATSKSDSSSDQSSQSSHHKNAENLDYDKNTYLTIFDNIFKKTIQDLTLRENFRKDLMKFMGQEQSYAFQKLNILENKANKEFNDKKKSDKQQGSIVVMENPLSSSDVRLMNQDLMRGKYEFRFPE